MPRKAKSEKTSKRVRTGTDAPLVKADAPKHAHRAPSSENTRVKGTRPKLLRSSKINDGKLVKPVEAAPVADAKAAAVTPVETPVAKA